jgi:Mrp family chromosome partitioning ATPase
VPTVRRPLLVTADADLLDELIRIAASVDVLLDVAADVPSARAWFGAAPLVLIGVDLAPGCARAGLRRRRDVVVVGRFAGDGPPDWGVADELRADHIAALPAAEPWLARRLALAGATPPSGGPSGVSRPGRGFEDGVPSPVPASAGAVPDELAWPGWDELDDQRPGALGGPPPAAAGVSRSRGLIVSVVGGRGGAGASVLAAGLALTAARAGVATLLVDADPLGGGLDLVLGWESVAGPRWPGLVAGLPEAVLALPHQAGLAALSYDRTPTPRVGLDSLAAVLAHGRRTQQLVVVDVPRHFDDRAMLALTDSAQVYLVVPAQLRACAAAARVVDAARQHCDRLSVVVRGPAPGGLTVADVTTALSLPCAGYLRSEPGLARDLERGLPPARDTRGPLAVLCGRLLADLDLIGQAGA